MTVKLPEVVSAYIACGDTNGYFISESILMKHLPDNKPAGKCKDVMAKDRPAFLKDLQDATKNGVKITKGRMVIMRGRPGKK